MEEVVYTLGVEGLVVPQEVRLRESLQEVKVGEGIRQEQSEIPPQNLYAYWSTVDWWKDETDPSLLVPIRIFQLIPCAAEPAIVVSRDSVISVWRRIK